MSIFQPGQTVYFAMYGLQPAQCQQGDEQGGPIGAQTVINGNYCDTTDGLMKIDLCTPGQYNSSGKMQQRTMGQETPHVASCPAGTSLKKYWAEDFVSDCSKLDYGQQYCPTKY